jgi:hypothetical protein
MSADTIFETSLGVVSKCVGHAPAGIIYSIVTFSVTRFDAKSASIEFVQIMVVF